MEGFMHWRISPGSGGSSPGAGVLPAVLVIGLRGDSSVTDLLNLSQVVLALQLPFAMFPLLHFTSSRRRMGKWRSGWFLLIAGWGSAGSSRRWTSSACRSRSAPPGMSSRLLSETPETAPPLYGTILVTLDATPTDRAILDHVKRLAKRCGPAGWSSCTWPTAGRRGLYGAEAVSPEISEDTAYLRQDARRVRVSAGIPSEVALAFGDPVAEIVRWVRRRRLRPRRHEHPRTRLPGRPLPRHDRLQGPAQSAGSGAPAARDLTRSPARREGHRPGLSFPLGSGPPPRVFAGPSLPSPRRPSPPGRSRVESEACPPRSCASRSPTRSPRSAKPWRRSASASPWSTDRCGSSTPTASSRSRPPS